MSHPAGSSDTSPVQDRLDMPRYAATFGESVRRYFKKYATFSGRASRSEYWWVALLNVLVLTIAGIAALLGGALGLLENPSELPPGMLPGMMLFALYALVTFIPGLALTVRRFHDGNFSGWLYLLGFVPGFGSLFVFVLALMPSNPAGARFDR